MASKQSIIDEFTLEKTHDVFKSVAFTYGNQKWEGAIPKYIERQGIEFSENDLKKKIADFYKELSPKNRKNWVHSSNNHWSKKDNQTYKDYSLMLS